VSGAPPGTPAGMMADFELQHAIRAGEDAAAELAARRRDRPQIRGIDPQAKLNAHHCGPRRAAAAIALPRAAPGPAHGATAA
jgi:hypothetical protein